MNSGFSYRLKKLLGLRTKMSMSFHVLDFIFRKLLRQNPGVTWGVHHTSTIHTPYNIRRGKNVYPGDSPGVYMNGVNGIYIGDYSDIGPNSCILSGNHEKLDLTVHIKAPPIEIGRYCWIGANTVILPSVVLGDFTVVAAGAIVTKSFPDGYAVIGGNPAKVLKQLNRSECDAFAAGRD